MSAVPPGFSTLTPSLNIKGASEAIEFYQKALGASLDYKMMIDGSDKVMHACLTVGTSKLFVSDENPSMGCGVSSSSFYVYMEDVDQAVARAKGAGMNEISPVQDMFWGDRTGSLRDKFGVMWTIASHVRDVSPAEMEEGRKSFMDRMKAQHGSRAA